MRRLAMLLAAVLLLALAAASACGEGTADSFFATGAPFAPAATPVPEGTVGTTPTNTPTVLFFAPTATPEPVNYFAPTATPAADTFFASAPDDTGEGEVKAMPKDAAGSDAAAFAAAQDGSWRTGYYNFIRWQGYAEDALSRLGLDEAEFWDNIAPNTTFALHDMDGDGVPELLISLIEQYGGDPMCVLFYRCGASGVEYLGGIRPGCYMFTCAKDAGYPGVAGYHRSDAGYDELIYIGLDESGLKMELVSRISYDTDNASGVDETQVTYDDALYQLFGAEPANASNGVYYMVYAWQCAGLDETGWDEYLDQWYDGGDGLEAESPEWESDEGAPEYEDSSDYDGYGAGTYDYDYDGGYSYWDGGPQPPYAGAPGSYVTAVSGDTYVRTGPGLYYTSLGVLYRGASLPYTGSVVYDSRPVAWYSVQYNGMQAWVSSRYTAIY